jgi:hypothetical protein
VGKPAAARAVHDKVRQLVLGGVKVARKLQGRSGSSG